MSEEIKRYRFKGAAGEYVYANDFDTAQSELAALREERDQWRAMVGHICATIPLADVVAATETGQKTVDYFKELQQRLADAERRNADQLEMLHMAKELISTISLHRTMAPNDWCDSFKAEVADRLEKLRAATQPTESGASE